MAKEEKRFKRVYGQSGLATGETEVWVDTKTKVCYLFHASGYAGGFTVLVDAEGKPMLWREPLED